MEWNRRPTSYHHEVPTVTRGILLLSRHTLPESACLGPLSSSSDVSPFSAHSFPDCWHLISGHVGPTALVVQALVGGGEWTDTVVDITQLILCESPCTRSGQPPRAHGFQVESLPSYTRDWLSLYLLATCCYCCTNAGWMLLMSLSRS